MGFPGGSDGKESACSAGDQSSIPGLGRSPGEGNGNSLQHSYLENPVDSGGNSLQYSCLENPVDSLVDYSLGDTKSWTQLSH